LLDLRSVSRRDVEHAGVKAASLGELARAGFSVPEGFVLTTAAFERFVAHNAFCPDSLPETVARGLLPADVTHALITAATGLGGVSLAVRSSGVAEDLSGASFAGQYMTVLDVRGADALADAVRKCWASAFSERVAAYRAARGHPGVVGMAVLVQRLVQAEAAGVAFTANPVTGDRTETVVNAVRGLGERLVSGRASPDEWLVKGDEATCRRAPEDAIDAARARAIADLARRVEWHFGTPQDIEWALSDGRLFLLQARPITRLPEETPIPVPVEPPPGFWQRETSHYPRPVSPMFRTPLAVFNLSLRSMMSEFSLLADAIEFREIGGWVYRRLVPLGGRDRPAPPAWLMPLLIRVVRPIRTRIRGAVEAVRSDKAGFFIQQWYAEWKPDLVATMARLREVDLTAVSDEDLDRHIAAVLAFFRRSLSIHTLVNGAVLVRLAEIAFACRDLLGWDDRRTFELLNGLSEKSSEPSRRLAELAQMTRDRPAVRRLLERIDHDTVERLADADRDFAEAFAAYQLEFGCRALGEVADPTLAERPTLVLGLVRDQLVRRYDPAADAAALEGKRTAAIAEARTRLAGRPAGDRERFERALARAERAYPLREDNQSYAVSAPMALTRYGVLELGRRLANHRQIAQRDDVFWLELDEARTALRQGGDARVLVAHRKAERAWVEAHPGPASHGQDPGPPPSLAALPAEARFLMQALLWAAQRVFAAEPGGHDQAAGETLRGIAASPGMYTGPARVIRNEAEFTKLQPGDVLVCPMTSPAWSVLFPSVGALVTDAGGTLSHPAIIAREYRVPAVVATGNATRLLRDGQAVTVDGTIGTVAAGTTDRRSWRPSGAVAGPIR
jgi:pyruvate,water dikinase